MSDKDGGSRGDHKGEDSSRSNKDGKNGKKEDDDKKDEDGKMVKERRQHFKRGDH